MYDPYKLSKIKEISQISKSCDFSHHCLRIPKVLKAVHKSTVAQSPVQAKKDVKPYYRAQQIEYDKMSELKLTREHKKERRAIASIRMPNKKDLIKLVSFKCGISIVS